jgi:predicted Zn-dependent peptidase
MIHTVTEHTLSTGTKGLLIDVPGSEVINILIRFNSGYQFSPDGKYELSHFVEHLIANGNEDYPSAEGFKVEVAKNGAYRNAHTGPRVNGYVLECAAFELERILDLLVGYLGKPLFPDDSFETELNNVREELNRVDTEPFRVCNLNLHTKLWPKEVQPVKSRLAQLAAISPEDVRDFYHRTHTARNMRFYVAGSLVGRESLILNRMTELTSLLAEGERFAPSQAQAASVQAPIVEKRDLSSIYYDFVAVGRELDVAQRHAGSLVRTILVGGYQGRIFGPMRKRGLAYTIGGSIHSQHGRSELEFYGYVTAATIEPLFELITGELERLKQGELSVEELQANQNLLLGSVTRSVQTSNDLLDWYADHYDTWDELSSLDSELEAYARVTVDQVIDVTRRVTSPQATGMSFVGKVSPQQAKAYTQLITPIWH